jgi:hypothetical protein
MQTWSATQVNQVSSARKEPVTVEPAWDFAYLQSHITDQMQWRYELIRPLVLFEIGTPRQRAHETHTHPGTVRTFVRQFQKQGMLGLMLGDVVVVKRGRTPRVPEQVRQEIHRLKALYGGFHDRELARIILCKFHYRIDDKTVKQLWLQSPVAAAEQPELWTYQSHPDRVQARLQVVKLNYQGWDKISISRFLHVSRPTVDRWIARIASECSAVSGDMAEKEATKRPLNTRQVMRQPVKS